jgi:hypothetical protein
MSLTTTAESPMRTLWLGTTTSVVPRSPEPFDLLTAAAHKGPTVWGADVAPRHLIYLGDAVSAFSFLVFLARMPHHNMSTPSKDSERHSQEGLDTLLSFEWQTLKSYPCDAEQRQTFPDWQQVPTTTTRLDSRTRERLF